jgi:hypothetical protein
MLQRLLSLFFPHKRPDPKMGSLVESLTPTKLINGLLACYHISTSPSGWLNMLTQVELDEQRLKYLDHCFVDQVIHWVVQGLGWRSVIRTFLHSLKIVAKIVFLIFFFLK